MGPGSPLPRPERYRSRDGRSRLRRRTMSARRRSFWGWGYEDRFPNAEARAALAAQVGLFLGTLPSPREPVALDSIALSPPRVVPPPELGGSMLDEDRIRHTH